MHQRQVVGVGSGAQLAHLVYQFAGRALRLYACVGLLHLRLGVPGLGRLHLVLVGKQWYRAAYEEAVAGVVNVGVAAVAHLELGQPALAVDLDVLLGGAHGGLCCHHGTVGSHGALDAGAATSYLKEHVTRFKDAVQGDWYYNSVMFVGTRGIMNGYNNGQGYFGALDLLARQDAASLIYNLLGHGQDAPDHGFADVVDGSYYQTAVNWCAEQGIFKGYAGTNLFGVNQPISREELMCVIYNIAAEKGAQVDASAFYAMPDHASTNSWAVNAAKWTLSTGVINGSKQPDGSTLLLPWALTTRGEMAAIMMNSIKNGVLPDVA